MGRLWLLAAMFVLSTASIAFLAACKEGESTVSSPQAAITVLEPKSDDWVKIPMTVKGTSNVSEGPVIMSVETADGSKTFCKTSATANSKGSFKAQIAFPPPYKAPTDAVLKVYNESPTDGGVQNLVSVPFVIWHILPPVYIDWPLCGDEVKSPARIVVTNDQAEGDVVVVIKDSSGSELARAVQVAGGGTLSQDVDFSLPDGRQAGTVEAFISPRLGIFENVFSVPVTLVP